MLTKVLTNTERELWNTHIFLRFFRTPCICVCGARTRLCAHTRARARAFAENFKLPNRSTRTTGARCARARARMYTLDGRRTMISKFSVR